VGEAKAVNDAQMARKKYGEMPRHNRTMEAIGLRRGSGLYLKPNRKGLGVYMYGNREMTKTSRLAARSTLV
jgi:hypothetical protein